MLGQVSAELWSSRENFVMQTLYIVVPCYNEQEVLEDSNRQLLAVANRLEAEGKAKQVRVLYVDDGSRDRTWRIIARLVDADAHVAGLKLAHNVGHQNALWAGLEQVAERADATVSIDADLQDDIEVIHRMVDDALQGYDVVYGVRRERSTDTFFKRQTAQGFYRVMRWMGAETVYNHADFRLLSRRALSSLLAFPERNLFLRGMVPMVGLRSKQELYDRKERTAGESKYPLRKMISFAADGITSFSVKPIRFIFYVGVAFVLISLGVIVYALWQHHAANTIPGWTSLLVSLWFIGGSIMIALGVVGEYIGKMYKEVKRRPRYVVEEVIL